MLLISANILRHGLQRYEIVNGVVEVDGIKNESSVETLAEDKASEGYLNTPEMWNVLF